MPVGTTYQHNVGDVLYMLYVGPGSLWQTLEAKQAM